MSNYRFNLDKGNKKFHCPSCKKKRFVCYIDIETGEYLPLEYGRCDRESKCGYHLNPYSNGYAKAIWEQEQGFKSDWRPLQPRAVKKPVNKPEFIPIPFDVFSLTRSGYEKNTFIQNLLSKVAFPFEVQDIEKVISLYHLGTVQNGYRSGAITFPFIDKQDRVRTIQVKQFDEANHTTGTDFLHSMIEKHHTRNNKPVPDWLQAYNKNDTKVSCLFGEHLLTKYPHNPIALVEAPKTAIYGTLYFGFPEDSNQFIWLAVYNLSSLTLEKCRVLKDRVVVLFPDLSKDGHAFKEWSDKASRIEGKLSGSTVIKVSDLLEKEASQEDKDEGSDLADFLIKQDWRQYRKLDKPVMPHPAQTIQEDKDFFKDLLQPRIDSSGKDDWSEQINEIETFFYKSPKANLPRFVETHLSYVKANNGNKTFLPYLHRLQELKEYYQNNIEV